MERRRVLIRAESPKKKKQNQWKYKETLPILLELTKLDQMDIGHLSCRMDYELKTMNHELDDQAMNNHTYQMFGFMTGQKLNFMRQWLRCFTLTNKHYVHSVASTYFKLKGLKLSVWLNGVKTGKKQTFWQYFYYAKQLTHIVLFILRISSGKLYLMTQMTTQII